MCIHRKYFLPGLTLRIFQLIDNNGSLEAEEEITQYFLICLTLMTIQRYKQKGANCFKHNIICLSVDWQLMHSAMEGTCIHRKHIIFSYTSAAGPVFSTNITYLSMDNFNMRREHVSIENIF